MADELQPQYSDIIFSTSPEGNVSVEVIFNEETFWLSQKRMAELFGEEVHTINYHLDAIIAVGYRVNSYQATQFRIWATKTLREFIIKGFVLDDERLKQGKRFGKDYFDELLERIREIRASERRFCQKITNLPLIKLNLKFARETNMAF